MSFNLSSFDYFNRQEKPSITLCNPDYTELYSLNACYETEFKLKWNAQSEFNFTFPQYANGIKLPAFDCIEGKRIVKIDGIGYFIISEVQDDSDGIVPIKVVKSLSHESELVYKKVTLFEGTFLFYNSASPTDSSTLMGFILGLIPNWNISSIDSGIANLYRTFNVSDTNVYKFLTTDVATAYNCVFSFDYMNRNISVISSSATPNPTDIFLSFDNLINKTQYKEITNEISTCLHCYGGGDLTIQDVNPLGTTAIYNFDYYKSTDWMTQDLINAINAWENKVSSNQTSYANLLVSLANYQNVLLTQQAQLVQDQSQLSADQQVLAVRLQQGLDVTAINAQIQIDFQAIQDQNALISITQTNINNTNSQLISINQSLAFTNTSNFTVTQLAQLENFIFENTYKNDNIITTSDMTFSQMQAQSQQLYNVSQTVLAKTSVPRYQITIDSINFLALKQYVPFINQMVLGNQITVDSGRGYFFYATLLEYDFSYENPDKFTIILSNSQRIDDSHFIFSDMFGLNSTASTDIKYNQTNWNDWSVNKPTIIGNVIAPDGSTKYGIKSGSLVGTITANNLLAITNLSNISSASNIRIDQNGVVLNNATLISGSNTGINGDITTSNGGTIHFRGGIYVGSTGLTPGTTVSTYEDLTGQTGSYLTLSKVFLTGTLRVYLNGLAQRLNISYQEGSNVKSVIMLDPVLTGDVIEAEYVSLT